MRNPGIFLAVVFVVALFSVVPPALAQELTAREIVDRAVARAQSQREARVDLGFESVIEVTTEFLDGDGEVEKTERETYLQYPLEGVVFEELIAKDGTPLDDDDVREETERKEQFAADVRKRKTRGEALLPESEDRIRFDREFVDRYRFWLVGEETVSGHPSWIIDLAPRNGNLPVRRRIDHALNHSTGRIWVSKEDYGLPRVEFEMAESVRFWGGILGTLRSTFGSLGFTRVRDGVWLPTIVDVRFDLRILFRNIRRRVVREWSKYEPQTIAE